MSADRSQDAIQWDEAGRWFAKAREDIDAARLLANAGRVDPAAFHAQQALEKILKGLLVARREDVRKTHDIEALAALAHRHWPTLISEPYPLAHLTRWYLVSRYPEIEEASPTAAEVANALESVAVLLVQASQKGL